MIRFILLFFSLFLLLRSEAQTKVFAFSDSLSDNVMMLEKVQDTIVCVRSTRKGIEWSLFDTGLNIIEKHILNTNIQPLILMQQLKSLSSSVGYIKQRITGNKFEISAKELPLKGDKNFDSLKVVYTEDYKGQIPRSLNFFFLGSPSNNYLMLYRFERVRDSSKVLMKTVILDQQLNNIAEKDIYIPVNPLTQSLMAIGIDDRGDVFAVSGDKYESYVLGTEMNICIFEAPTQRLTQKTIKIPRQKIQNVLIESTRDSLRFFCTASTSNVERQIDCITTLSINKKTFAFNLENNFLEREVKKQVARILTGNNKTSMDFTDWVGLESNKGSTSLVASVRTPIKSVMPFRSSRTVTTSSAFQPGFSDRPMSAYSSGLFSPFSNVTSLSERFKRNYREIFLMINKKDNTLTVDPLLPKTFYSALQLPKLYFHSPSGSKIIYSVEKKNKFRLAVSEFVNGSFTETLIVPETGDCFIDQNMSPLFVNKQLIFVYKNAATNASGLILVK